MFLSMALENIVWQETVVSRPLRVSIQVERRLINVAANEVNVA